jgi:hypothetical protein
VRKFVDQADFLDSDAYIVDTYPGTACPLDCLRGPAAQLVEEHCE